MTPAEIQHFLVVYSTRAGKAEVRSYGTDYDAALAAYADLEADIRKRSDADIDVVLLSADSLETIRRTHSSYFDTGEDFESLLPPGTLNLA